MWSSSKKEKQENKVTKTTTYESYVSRTSQSLTVNNFTETYRTGSVINSPRSITPTGRLSLLGGNKLDNSQKSTLSPNLNSSFQKNSLTRPFSLFDNNVNLPLSQTRKFQSDIKLDATPFNPNYQSPYRRNSTGYSSFQTRSPVPGTGTIYRSALPAAEQPMPTKKGEKEQPSNKKLLVKKTKKLYDGSENQIPTYSTHSKKRGEVLIINNIMFKDKGHRHGAKMDDEKLKDLFKQMGFSVNVERDLKKSAMVAQVKSFSKRSSLKYADIAIVVIMSHGTKNETLGGTEVFGLDEQGVLVEELMNFFNEKDCKSMVNKPKIFIFQCCRGDNENFIQNDAVGVPCNVQPLADALIAYSSLPGFVSHRDPERGTWYISTICDIFSEYAHEYHVEDLLKMVNEKLGTYAKNVKQTTHYENRGFKRCYLHPM